MKKHLRFTFKHKTHNIVCLCMCAFMHTYTSGGDCPQRLTVFLLSLPAHWPSHVFGQAAAQEDIPDDPRGSESAK